MINADKILKLINKNKWDDILKLLKKGEIKQDKIIINGNLLTHLASIGNHKDIIEYYITNKIDLLSKNNDEGLNSYHIMAKYGYYDILKKSIVKDPNSVNLIDDEGNTILHYLIENNDTNFEWFLENIPNIDLSISNKYGNTLLHKAISKSYDETDIYYDRLNRLVDEGIDINYPNNNYPLLNAIKQKKSYIANLLINEGANFNIKDKNYLTPFLLSIYHELEDTMRLLIDRGVDIDYVGPEGDNNPLILTLSRGNNIFSDILLENGFNVKKFNRDMNTPLHIAFSEKNKLKPSTISKLLFYGDLNIQNMNGDTPLHLFLNNYDWDNYGKILENKKMDIFIENHKKKKPIDYISNKKLVPFLDIVTNSFINHYNISDICNSTKKEECFNQIKQYILKNKISFYKEDANTDEKNQIELIVSPNAIKGKFNSDVLHNVVYTTIILERNKNLGIPFQHYNKTKAATLQMLITNTNFLYTSQEGSVIYELVDIYHDYFFIIAPYLILWRNKNLYYIDKYIDFYTQKCLNSDKIRFIFFKLTLISSGTGTHANIIIFDKETGILERFEPYGIIPYLDNDSLDHMIKDKIGGFLKDYLKKRNKNLKYYGPNEMFEGVSFQILSNDTSSKVKKMGDPRGFCLAWTLWYLEMRIKNPSVNPKTLIQKAVDKIKGIDDKKYRSHIFINFIRNYAASLDEDKNKILIKSGIDKEHVYNLEFNEEDNKKLFNEIKKRITNAVAKRT